MQKDENNLKVHKHIPEPKEMVQHKISPPHSLMYQPMESLAQPLLHILILEKRSITKMYNQKKESISYKGGSHVRKKVNDTFHILQKIVVKYYPEVKPFQATA